MNLGNMRSIKKTILLAELKELSDSVTADPNVTAHSGNSRCCPNIYASNNYQDYVSNAYTSFIFSNWLVFVGWILWIRYLKESQGFCKEKGEK